MGEQNTMKEIPNKVEVTIHLQGQEPLKIVGQLDELHYEADYPTVQIDLRNAKFVVNKND